MGVSGTIAQRSPEQGNYLPCPNMTFKRRGSSEGSVLRFVLVDSAIQRAPEEKSTTHDPVLPSSRINFWNSSSTVPPSQIRAGTTSHTCSGTTSSASATFL